jgi:PAS domain S-box-containing protein
MDLDYNVTYTNSMASKIFGYSTEEFSKGLKMFQFLAPEDEDLVLERLNHLFKGEYTEPLVVRLRRKNGTFFYANIYARRIFKNNEVIGVRSIIHDITRMKEAQEKLKESEDKFKTIAEQSLLGICIIQDELVKYINHVLADLLGYSVPEILNWKQGEFFKTIHPKDKKKVIELATKKDNEFENGIRYYEARGIKKNGEITWLEVYYKKITYQKKPAFLISFLNINERKKAKEKLKESEQKYRFLFEKSPSSILLIDIEGKIVDCNPALEKLLGYNKKELIGKKYKDLKVIPSRHIPLLLQRLKRISKGKPLQPLDIEFVKKDGSLIWVNIESSLVKLGNKNFIIIMGHDVSEKKSIEMKLKELDEMRRQFIDRASHELKTPITTIYGAFQLLDKFHKQKFDGESSGIFEMALSGTKRLKKLVDSLLDLSLLESKMFKLEKSNTDLTNLIRKCVNEGKYLMKSRNQTYDLSLPNSLHINVDDSRIELVLTNLLTNAIKYTPTGGEITIKLDNIGNFAQISVKDTGIGLTKDELNKLFKKFSKIQTPLRDELGIPLESTGLGLHITKRIVQLHGGEIWAESEGRHKGSTFFVTLPNRD